MAAVGLGLVILWGGAKREAGIGCCLGGGAGAVVWVVIGSCCVERFHDRVLPWGLG